MGLTAIGIVYSHWGKQSGAHLNPSVTLTFLRLGKILPWDAGFYIGAQFLGGASAVALLSLLLGPYLSHSAVNYAATVPGRLGVAGALGSEFAISFLLMILVLGLISSGRLSRYTGFFVGAAIALFISVESPLSGMSMNPARTFSSALSADVWTGLWVYFIAPPVGMLAAAELFRWTRGSSSGACAKLHHENSRRCIFCGANGGFSS